MNEPNKTDQPGNTPLSEPTSHAYSGYQAAKEKASATATGAAQQGSDQKSRLTETARAKAEELKEKGREQIHRARNQGQEMADRGKHQIGSRISGYGQAIQRAADKLREEQDPNIAHYAEVVADKLHEVGSYFENRDTREILADVEATARRRPELVLGAMFITGLAIARFLKASQHRDEEFEESSVESMEQPSSYPTFEEPTPHDEPAPVSAAQPLRPDMQPNFGAQF